MRLIICSLSLAVFLSGLLPAETAPAEAEVRQLVARYVDIRNHMDEAALRSLFTQDADQLVSNGRWRRGLDELVTGAMASSKKENGRSSVIIESVRMLGADAAIADGRYETSSGEKEPRKMWSTFVLRLTAEGWKITAIRNMLPVPAVR